MKNTLQGSQKIWGLFLKSTYRKESTKKQLDDQTTYDRHCNRCHAQTSHSV